MHLGRFPDADPGSNGYRYDDADAYQLANRDDHTDRRGDELAINYAKQHRNDRADPNDNYFANCYGNPYAAGEYARAHGHTDAYAYTATDATGSY
jgi:hypothetical protein